jgi:hypothetical protein
MSLKRAPAIPFENKVSIESTKHYYFHTQHETLHDWESNNVSYYMKRMLMHYSKFPLLMYDDATYWSMFDKVNIIQAMTPSREKELLRQVTLNKYTRTVIRLFISDLCLCLSITPLPSVLAREVAGYLFGDMDTMFPAPKKEVPRVHRAIKASTQAAVKATNKKRRKAVP